MPIFFSSGPTLTPSMVRSTMNALKSVPFTFAYTMNTSANPAFVMNCFVPFRM